MKAKSLIPTRRTFQLANLTVIYGFSHPRMAFEHWTRENVHNINAIFFRLFANNRTRNEENSVNINYKKHLKMEQILTLHKNVGAVATRTASGRS